ncbi:MAG: coenzyme F420-0:L-glutamate ligase [Oscillospiraceae bacterium]|nr:coenzyme F420-0:L-glutamate ligase [Oscillospiraceae bacterium]
MKRTVGTTIRGIRSPLIKRGDDLVKILADSLEAVIKSDNISLRNDDVIGVTETVVAKAQQNYALLEDVKQDIQSKYGNEIGIVFPILSRNRFSDILRAVAMSTDKIYIQLSYPGDEVGNKLITEDMLEKTNINPYSDVLTEEEFYNTFKESKHQFTGVDYIQLYKTICEGKAEIIFSNDPRTILKYTKSILVSDIHTRHRTKRILKLAGAEIVYGLDDIMTKPINGSGYNPDYGVLGSNLSADDKLKLFPRNGTEFTYAVQEEIKKRFGVTVNVLIYGDGCFKDPVGGIWELADPVVSPGYTSRLEGVPNEIKLKYIADTEFQNLSGEDAENKMKDYIKNKPKTNDTFSSQGTTPRRLVDLIGSLCDLTTGSGDKGTPFVLVQGYFDTYADA